MDVFLEAISRATQTHVVPYRANGSNTAPVITFFTGFRFQDGYGDLGANRIIISELLPWIRETYGENVRVNIVFNAELKGNRLIDPLTGAITENFSVESHGKYGIVRSFFNEGEFDGVGERLFESDGNGRWEQAGSGVFRRGNTTFFTEESYLSDSSQRADLHITGSIPRIWGGELLFQEAAKRGLSIELTEYAGHFVRGSRPLMRTIWERPGTLLGSEVDQSSQINSLLIGTGISRAGLLLEERGSSNLLSKNQIVQLIAQDRSTFRKLGKETLNSGQAVRLYNAYLGKTGADKILERTDPFGRLIYMLKVAQHDFRLNGDQIVFTQNVVRAENLESFLEKMPNDLREFFDSNVDFRHFDRVSKQVFNSLQAAAFMNATTGDISLSQSIAKGVLPMYETRKSKREHIADLKSRLEEIFVEQNGQNSNLGSDFSMLLNLLFWRSDGLGSPFPVSPGEAFRLLSHQELQGKVNSVLTSVREQHSLLGFLKGLISEILNNPRPLTVESVNANERLNELLKRTAGEPWVAGWR